MMYALAVSLYDSYLKQIVDPAQSAKLSGIAWGFGYLGGILCFALCYPLLKGGLHPENLGRYRLVFVITAIFYFLFSIPAFLFLPRQQQTKGPVAGISLRLMREAYRELWRTLRGWKDDREIFKFLLASYFVSDAIVTVIYFTAIFLQVNFHLGITQILLLTLVVQVIGVPATAIFGWFGDRFNKKKMCFVTILIWVGVVLIMVFGTQSFVPYIMAVAMGLVLGSTQALLRSILADMVPEDRTAEFFGFNTFAGKVSSILGPLTFGLIAFITGNQRLGLASLLLFFLVGGVVLLTVKTDVQGLQGESGHTP
jgi:UMF1 family MFS transporter